MASNMKLIACLIVLIRFSQGSLDLPSCDSKIYCQGELLDVVQKARIFTDSKSFVDQKMLYDEITILNNFDELMITTREKPSRSQVKAFVESNFVDGDELMEWTPPDYYEYPYFLRNVKNYTLREFAHQLVKIWPTLARQVKPEVAQNPERYSLIPVPNGFIVPGGRFKEVYYWDSYWIIKGLLISDMKETARMMIENLLHLVNTYGFIPNGARIYYLNRAHPPLLTPMVNLYMKATDDIAWLKKNIRTLEDEIKFYLKNKTVDFEVDGETYTLAHYNSPSGSPRPESYGEDVETCSPLEDEGAIKECYADLKSGAESGWDFSFRWVFDKSGGNNANRTHIQTRRVIPVDLNSMLAMAMRDISLFHKKLGNTKKSNYWMTKFLVWRNAIHEVLYNEDEGVWFDFDLKNLDHRKYFYPSNLAPLWAEIYDPDTAKLLGRNAYQYILEEKILDFWGGIPSSLNNTGEQWDYPSAWAPLQSIVIQGLLKSGYSKAEKLAATLAERWVQANLIGFQETGDMFEKYDAEHPGKNGGGGEYVVQTGFGWTNGVALETIVDFFSDNLEGRNRKNGKIV